MTNLVTKSKKVYNTIQLDGAGFGPNGWRRWAINSVELLTQEEVEEIIESQYPFAGYGSSQFRRLQKLAGRPYEIEVTSNASCD